MDEKTVLPGLKQGILGSSSGNEKTIETELPKDYPAADVAGKKAVFTVKIHQIKEKDLPKVDDDFAKGMGQYKDLKELKERIRQDIRQKKQRQVRVDMENQLLDSIVKNNSKFPIPVTLVEKQLDALVRDAKSKLLQRGFKNDEVEPKTDQLRQNLRREAEKRVRLFFIVDEIARKENIKVSGEELDNTLKALAKQYNKGFEQLKEEYEKKDLLGNIAEDIRENKVVEFLISNADIKEG
jgi:trigger factor